jgi:hypothetical protein
MNRRLHGLRVGLDAVQERKILYCRESNPDIKPVARRYADYYYYYYYYYYARLQ